MKSSAALLVVLFASSTALGSALLRPQEQAAPPPPVSAPLETGPQLFVSSGCSHCHTIDGSGGVKGPNLSGIGRRWKNDAIRHQIEDGALEMPPYKDVLNEAQITTLVNYLHTRRAREPKVKATPPPTPVAPPADPS